MKNLLFTVFLLHSSMSFAAEMLEDYTPVGSLKTKNYLVEIGTKDSASAYMVKTHEGKVISDLMTDSEFLSLYPDLYDSVTEGVADDASLNPEKVNRQLNKNKLIDSGY